MATPTADPIAVASPAMPISSWSRKVAATPWSSVSGHWVKASSPKTTRPTRSLGRAAMNVWTTPFATSSRSLRRLNERSCASRSSARIDPEVSITSTMSIPSVLTSVSARPVCGRMTASRIRATTRSRSAETSRRAVSAPERGVRRAWPREEYATAALSPPAPRFAATWRKRGRSHHRSAQITYSGSSTQSQRASAKTSCSVMPPSPLQRRPAQRSRRRPGPPSAGSP